jgi:hypothetical protein
LMIENREEKASKNAEFAVMAKSRQSATPKICSIVPPSLRQEIFF